MVNQTVNPDFDEKQYASQILQILLEQTERDFHLVGTCGATRFINQFICKSDGRKTRRFSSQTAEIARRAKDEKRLILKEYTALSTVAKSQFARLAGMRPSPALYRLEKEISRADSRKIGYLKWAMYGTNCPTHPDSQFAETRSSKGLGFAQKPRANSETGERSGPRAATAITV